MSAPVVTNIEQMPEGPMQGVFVPMQYCFMPPQDMCAGMWVPAQMPGGDTMWSPCAQGGPQQNWQGRQMYGNRRGGKPFAEPPAHASNNAAFQYSEGDLSWKQNSQEPVTVKLDCLPTQLCSQKMLEVVIDQSGLEHEVQSVKIENSNSAILIMAGEAAAQRCVQHFNGLRWVKNADPVSAQRVPKADDKKATKPRKPMLPMQKVKMNKGSDLVKGTQDTADSPMSKASTACPSPLSTCSSPPVKTLPRRPRWADYDMDSDTDDQESKSTHSGTFDAVESGDSSNTES